ncbi:4'-phosphopantetheinyl transferase superfamily protein [Streptomyces sp. NBC_01498]|uniref:4'-phosphopantetheinyl transferase family protein n=1 Tax=Streptomyces sp. NBC_01498 TaxID=2975870 RepID=UPI002E7C5172|nr:4'-phosphopantetheinyl transferase superfamily protein [Streptomyces sp. NBC_01498]WTL27975.1 4'-phosphopantetheinyl transferase superfamily protein [Streptomyces sp. NBC_01498]
MTAARPVGQVRVWALRQAPPWRDDVSLALLDAREQARAASFTRRHERSTYLAAHAGLRLLLADRLGVHPRDLRFGRDRCAHCGGPNGRPILLDAPGGPHFSLSHCAGITLVGIADVPVGVDVERLPGRRTVERCLARLHPRERAELLRVRRAELPLAFCRLWTRKEAYLKARGTGLGRGLDLDYLGTGGEGRPVGWSVVNLSCGPQDRTHAAALAVPRWVRVPAGPGELNWSAYGHVLGAVGSLKERGSI